MKKNCIIFDVDGTLSNPTHRLHYVTTTQPNWDKFFSLLHLDPPVEEVVTLYNVLDRFRYTYDEQWIELVVVSARPEDYEEETLLWLSRHQIYPDAIYMRPLNDHRKDEIIKEEILARIKADGYNPLLAIDDRPGVVQMWRRNNIPTLQVGHALRPKKPANLYIMVGPSRAGKSKYLANPLNKFAPKLLNQIISSDNLRYELCGDWKDQSRNDEVFNTLHFLVENRLNLGLDTWVDATNIRNKDRLAIVACAHSQVQIHYIVLNRPLEDKLKDRGEIPEDVVRRHHNTFQANLKNILAGDNNPNIKVI